MLLNNYAEFSFVVLTFLLFMGVNSQGSSSGTSCDANTYCTQIRRCRPLAILPDWQTAGETCSSGRGASRKVCCPRPTIDPRPRSEPIAVTSSTPPSSVLNNINTDCGRSRVSNLQGPLVAGVVNAAEGAWPWMTVITIRDISGVYSPWCTGFLIDRRHVLSAAHCFKDRGEGLYSTRIGSVNQNQGEVYPVENIAIPKGYKQNMFYDDIAILTLTRDVDFPNFTPICLPDKRIVRRNLVGRGTTVAGWGANEFGGQLRSTLKLLSAIPVVSPEDCNNVYSQRFQGFRRKFPRGITEGFICAGFLEGQTDVCGGDSGGPLMFQDRNRWFAIGIVSFGYACGQRGIPGGYTRVSAHLRWITETTRN